MDKVICSDAEVSDGVNGKCPNGTQEYNDCCQECYEKGKTCRKYCDYAFSDYYCVAREEIE